MPNKKTTNVTDEVPTLDDKTRTNVKKFAAVGIFAAGAILLIDDQVKKFKKRKTVEVTVVDNDTKA